MAEFNLKQIYDYWEQKAIKYGSSPDASWSDQQIMDLEIREILNWLADGDRVLDVGCANGCSTLQYALRKEVHILGVDFVPQMIRSAVELLEQMKDQLRGTTVFETGDILSLAHLERKYDKVLIKRVISNLGEYEMQLEGIRQCVRVLKPGALLVVSDATMQGWQKLNKFREEWGLTGIPIPPFNSYLDREKLIHDVPTAMELKLVETRHFASTYYVGTRVLKPLLIKALGLDIDAADPGMEWNRWFAQLPAWGNYGIQELFVFKKKETL
jgi:SAM-dependent methyltransferase